jgi:hypothetical protein
MVNRVCDRSNGPGNELAERAVVFLMDARATRSAVVFRVRTDCGDGSAAGRGRVDDADDARQSCLRERGGENPSTDKSRNASTHSVVSCDRAVRTT